MTISQVLFSNTPSFTAPSLGSFFQDGYYVGSLTYNGLTYGIIACPYASQSAAIQWKTTNTLTGVYSELDGFTNTYNSDPSVHPAAAHCLNLITNNYHDWYFPSINELYLMWTNRASIPGGQTNDAVGYWSSTEVASDAVWRVNFSNGGAFNDNAFPKTATARVRPVRRFRIA